MTVIYYNILKRKKNISTILGVEPTSKAAQISRRKK